MTRIASDSSTVHWLKASLRWIKHHGKKQFTTMDVYAIYSIICPAKEVSSVRSISAYLHKQGSRLGIKTANGQKYIRHDHGGNTMMLYEWREHGDFYKTRDADGT